jgi:hypothetical protein
VGVTGIGGLFFRAQDPEALAAWYAENLGVGGGEMSVWEQTAGPTVFSPFDGGHRLLPGREAVDAQSPRRGAGRVEGDARSEGHRGHHEPRVGCAGRRPVRPHFTTPKATRSSCGSPTEPRRGPRLAAMPSSARPRSGGARPEALFKPPPERQPLAARMRPRDLSEFVGQEHLVGERGPSAAASSAATSRRSCCGARRAPARRASLACLPRRSGRSSARSRR